MGNGVRCWWVKWRGRAADNSPLYSAEVNNEWSYRACIYRPFTPVQCREAQLHFLRSNSDSRPQYCNAFPVLPRKLLLARVHKICGIHSGTQILKTETADSIETSVLPNYQISLCDILEARNLNMSLHGHKNLKPHYLNLFSLGGRDPPISTWAELRGLSKFKLTSGQQQNKETVVPTLGVEVWLLKFLTAALDGTVKSDARADLSRDVSNK